MSYSYRQNKSKLHTDNGILSVGVVLGNLARMSKHSSAFMMQDLWKGTSVGDSWAMTACIDFLVEHKVIYETSSSNIAGQHRTFMAHHNFDKYVFPGKE